MRQEAFSLSEAATLLNVSRWTIYRLVKDGKLQAFTVRRCRRIYLQEIQRFKRQQSVLPDVARRSSI